MTHFPTHTTIEEAADHVLAQRNEANQAELRAMARDELWRCHFGLAMGIRTDDCSMAIASQPCENLFLPKFRK